MRMTPRMRPPGPAGLLGGAFRRLTRAATSLLTGVALQSACRKPRLSRLAEPSPQVILAEQVRLAHALSPGDYVVVAGFYGHIEAMMSGGLPTSGAVTKSVVDAATLALSEASRPRVS